MTHLTKPMQYDIEDSNIALLGSDLERRVREESGEQESAWSVAGQKSGLEIWRIEQFHVKPWPRDKFGQFYEGDSYIVLHTYKRTPEDESLLYDLHFWLGRKTTQDEAGTAAYKTVELDDLLGGKPVQYREVQGCESRRFLSYFPRFVSLKGGTKTGFQHLEPETPLELNNLYQISASSQVSHRDPTDTRGTPPSSNISIRQVIPGAESLNKGDVFVLDRGSSILQFNTRASSGKEKFAAAEFVRKLVDERGNQAEVTVYDEGGSGAGLFLSALNVETLPPKEVSTLRRPTSVYRLSDSSGTMSLEELPSFSRGSLSTTDAFIVDASGQTEPVVFVWIGKHASLQEKRLALEYAQKYLYDIRGKHGANQVNAAVPIVRIYEGGEPMEFWEILGQ